MLGLAFFRHCDVRVDRDPHHESHVPLAQERHEAVQEGVGTEQVPVPLAHVR